MLQKLSNLLDSDTLKVLKKEKSLLAFSAGVDSTALFFLLLEENIKFDIAIVDYGKRESSKDELLYAKFLAEKYHKKCFDTKVVLDDSSFEQKARDARYDFFEKCIKENGYKNLITAHQLNDRVEWFLMQFTKGAGCVELLGFEACEKRDNYSLIRPLINTSKEKLLGYLIENGIKYFEDASNRDKKYTRNRFRHNFSNELLKEYEKGITKSFEYLEIDKKRLFNLQVIKQIKKLYILKNSGNESENLRAIDKIIKRLGIIISAKQRNEIASQKDIVIAHKISVSLGDEKIYIAPYCNVTLDKKFKEQCRRLKIPPKIRAYLWIEGINPKEM